MFLTTHYLAEAEDLADRLAILHRGQIVRTGTPTDVAAAQPARISFSLPTGAHDRVPDLPGSVGIDDVGAGRGVVVHTRDLQRSLAALLGWASARALVLTDLDARSASVEEAFLAVAIPAADATDIPEMTA